MRALYRSGYLSTTIVGLMVSVCQVAPCNNALEYGNCTIDLQQHMAHPMCGIIMIIMIMAITIRPITA